MKPELDNIFTYHKPGEEQQEQYEAIRARGKDLATTVLFLCPDSRERSLAMTKIEEAVMWANAAIARQPAREEAGK